MLDDLLRRRAYNAVADFVDAPVARGLSEKVAFIDAERSLSYGELQTRTCRFAAALKNLGLRPEERLAVLLYDTIDFPVAFWGGVRAGIVVLPLNTLLTAEQYAYILSDSRASAIVVAAPLAKALIPSSIGCRGCARSFSSMPARRNGPRLPAATCTILPTSWPGDRPLNSSRRRCPTKSHSGCIHPARPANPRGSSTSTPR